MNHTRSALFGVLPRHLIVEGPQTATRLGEEEGFEVIILQHHADIGSQLLGAVVEVLHTVGEYGGQEAVAYEQLVILVQGSIDLLCELSDGRILICDYKTDRITPEERADASLLRDRMQERHADQIRQYAAAVREMYGRAPDETYIFSLPLGEALKISI